MQTNKGKFGDQEGEEAASDGFYFSFLFLNRRALIFGTQASSSQRRHRRVTGLESLGNCLPGQVVIPGYASDMAYEIATCLPQKRLTSNPD